MATPIDPTSLGFLMAESRNTPMHVASLQLYKPPEDGSEHYAQELYEQWQAPEEVAPLFIKRPHRALTTAGQWVWTKDDQFDIEHHVRRSALPQPGRVRELLELCSRLHGTQLALERPLWEATVIEGLNDGRLATYTKIHHALVDGVSSMRLLNSVLSKDPDERNMPAPWASRPKVAKAVQARAEAERNLAQLPIQTLRSAMGITAEAAGMPGALIKTLSKGMKNETASLSLYAPKTILNRNITGARRFAAQDWPIERIKAIGTATRTTLNDVVLAMCSGALRAYLEELNELPDATLVAMVPVGLKAKDVHSASGEGGNAVGAVMVKLGTNLPDPAARLAQIHASMKDGKEALSSMTPVQILAMSALGIAPSILTPMLRLQGIVRPPFNLVISNVPGPREARYFNGAQLLGMYPLSIPIHGIALNITCVSYDGNLAFGLTGCRRTLPHMQRLLTHLDDEIAALEKAAGL